MQKSYFEVADIVAKTLLAYVLVECDITITNLHEEMKKVWSKYDIDIPRQRFTRLLKNVYLNEISEDKKMAVLSVVIDTAFRHDEIYKYSLARFTADDRTDLVKTFHKMADRFNKLYGDENLEFVRYIKPRYSYDNL